MAYPLIILGAGASFDSQSNIDFSDKHVLDQWHPPLTNNIFETRRFYEILNKYEPQVSNLAAYISSKLKAGKLSFEDILTDLRTNKTSANPDLIQQLVALRFYIADLFMAVSKNYFRTVNNYQTLIQIINGTGRKACIVTFNYDLLFEKAFFTKLPEQVEEYISQDIKIIKLHGTCNWYFWRKINGWEQKSSYDFALLGAQYVLDSESTKYPIVIKNVETSKNLPSEGNDPTTKFTYLPAVALPLHSKLDYVCPDEHVNAMKSAIDGIDRIVIIGWKAGDPYLIQLLNEQLKDKVVPIAIVCGNNSKDTILKNLGGIAKNVKVIDQYGFSSFLNSDKCEEFLT